MRRKSVVEWRKSRSGIDYRGEGIRGVIKKEYRDEMIECVANDSSMNYVKTCVRCRRVL